MLGANAAALYGFDLDELAPLVEKIGPTPAEVSRRLTPEEMPKDTMSMAFSR
jgi:hypothetical protein